MVTRRDFLKGTGVVPLLGLPLPYDRPSQPKPRPFVHLHVQSHFSRPGGACRIDELVERSKSLGVNAVALTDCGNLFGAMAFYRAATRAGIKPIFGLQLFVSSHLRHQGVGNVVQQAGFPLTLLAKNNIGFGNLIQLSSAQCRQGDRRCDLVPIGKETLKAHAEGLICLSGGFEGELFQAVLRNQIDKAKLILRWHRKVFGGRFFVEIQSTGSTADNQIAKVLRETAKCFDVPSVVTCDVQYVEPTDWEAPSLLKCVATGRATPELLYSQCPHSGSYLLSPDEVYARFPDQQESLARTQEIADEIEVDLESWQRSNEPLSKEPDTGVIPRWSTESFAELRVRLGKNLSRGGLSTICVHGSCRKRDKLIAVLEAEYGPARVARDQVLFTTDSPRMQIRTVCSTLGFRCEQADEIVEMIPEDFPGTIQDAVAEIVTLREAVQTSSRVHRVVELAELLQGRVQIPAPCSVKAVVGSRPLVEKVPLVTYQGQVFTQWSVLDLTGRWPLQLFICEPEHMSGPELARLYPKNRDLHD